MTLAPDYVSPCGSIVLYRGDCLEIMPQMVDTVDAIICDLPYGTTQSKWDSVIPFQSLWSAYGRLIKSNGAVVLFGSEPFSSRLRMSNERDYRYDWIWKKNRATGHLDCKKKPMKAHETVSVFYSTPPTYNPQMRRGVAHVRGPRAKPNRSCETYGTFNETPTRNYESNEFYPVSVLEIGAVMVPKHPNEKPVLLLEYLIKTYTDEGETILDNTFGSGTAAIACLNTGRKFIGIEKDETYFAAAVARIESHIVKLEGEKEIL